MNSSVALLGVVKYWPLDSKGHRLTGDVNSFKSSSACICYLRGVLRDIWLIPYILPQDRLLDTAVGEGIRHFLWIQLWRECELHFWKRDLNFEENLRSFRAVCSWVGHLYINQSSSHGLYKVLTCFRDPGIKHYLFLICLLILERKGEGEKHSCEKHQLASSHMHPT